MFRSSSSGFDRLLEKATSQLLLEPEWDAILQICDAIRQSDVTPKYAMSAIRKKIAHENPHICMFALQVLESCVKNCGSLMHIEVATKDAMEFLKDQVKIRTDPVKGKLLELIQVWSHAFRNEPSYKIVQDTYHLMKMEGHQFPTLKEADAMFLAEKAPEWKDGDCCHRCRVMFGVVQRKHHCRNCGNIFCGKCSSKSSIIPKYGIEREVRVCEACFDQLNSNAAKKSSEEDLPAEYLASPLSQQPQVKSINSQDKASKKQTPATKSEQELQEEEELQLAIALSQSEAESSKASEKSTMRSGGNYTYSSSPRNEPATYSQPAVSAPIIDTSDMDPELARYLNRNYWEQKAVATTTTPSAPIATNTVNNSQSNAKVVTTTSVTAATPGKVQEQFQNGETSEQEQFLNALQGSINVFVNRMKSNSQRGRSIANDSSVQTLFMTINAMHPQLMSHVQEQEDLRSHYESLQDKLAQLRDAREALNALREEHEEKKRQEAEELERIRQIQMAQKLEIMRQKKQEYLEYQRQLALQRMQEQEREMHLRLEQQKRDMQMRQMGQLNYGYPPHQAPYSQSFSPGGSLEGSPLHHPYGQQPPAQQPQQGVQIPPGVQGPPMGSLPPGVNQTQYAPPASVSQAGYNPAALPGSSLQTVPPHGYAGVQQQQQPPTTAYQTPPGSYIPPQTQGTPPQGQGQPGYTPAPPAEYQPYNMQTLNNALPPQTATQQYSQGPGPQQYVPPQGQYVAPPGAVTGQPPNQQPGAQQQPEAQLISFD